jgi:trk system potassium uptake protein TrkH
MKKKFDFFRNLLTPIRSLTLGFSILSLLGAIILMMPFSSASGESTSFLDSLFTSVSAVTTTGLIVVDTGSYFNRFGQSVIMVLFQIGGLGYMIFISLAVLGFAGKISMTNRILLRESISRPTSLDLLRFANIIILSTILIELIGVFSLTIYWMQYFPFGEALYSALFHSISAFTTAGFSIYTDSFIKYGTSVYFNLITILVMVLGSLGFFVLYDLAVLINPKRKKTHSLSIHTKIVVSLTIILTFSGAAIILFSESWQGIDKFSDRILLSVFQASTASTTAGFNTLDIGLMTRASLFIIIILMYIGAGPGGTAGGIKQTSFGVILISLYNQLTGREKVLALKRKISDETVRRALSIAALAIIWFVFSVLVLTMSEDKDFLKLVFEVGSALGTVGLSTGITPDLSVIGKVVIIITMLIGRVGPLGIGLTILRKKHLVSYQYPDDEILVG